MKYVLTVFLLIFSASNLAANCTLEIRHGFWSNKVEKKKVPEGKVRSHAINDVRKVTNVGVRDAKIKVKGAAAAAWHKVNIGESYIGLVDLQKIQCLQSVDGPRPVLDQITDRAQAESEMTSNTVEGVAKEIDKRVDRAKELVKDLTLEVLDKVGTNQWLSVGRAGRCAANLGNQDNQRIANSDLLQHRGARGNRNKFDNFEVSSEFSVMNNYLLMQASNKTYYHQIKHGPNLESRRWKTAKTEGQYRCGATELYQHWGFEEVFFVNGALGGNAIIAEHDDFITIAVRGTQNPGEALEIPDIIGNNDAALDLYQSKHESIKGIIDVWTNVSHLPIPARPSGFGNVGNVHAGYAAAASELKVYIDALRFLGVFGDKPIFVTGHSLGAATATLLAKGMQNSGYNVSALYAFAPPKVGDTRFMQSMRSSLNVYVTWNYRDPVPTFVNSNRLKIGGKSLLGANKLKFAWEGADKFIFFDQRHTATIYEPNGNNHQEIFLSVREKQGAPYPAILLRDGFLSNEWFFHRGDFYTAFTFDHVRQLGLGIAPGTRIEPEFNREKHCLFWSNSFRAQTYDWNAHVSRFLNDKQSYPMQECVW